jgi:hypothetical protein
MKPELDQYILKDAREKLNHYVPDEHVPQGLIGRLRCDYVHDHLVPALIAALEEAAEVVDKHARRQGKKRMTDYAGRHHIGRAPFVDNKANAGQHYPQVQSFIDVARNLVKAHRAA